VGLISSSEQKDELDRWAETEFICLTLELDGVKVSRGDVARVVSAASPPAGEMNDISLAVADLLAAVRAVKAIVRADGRAAALTSELLIRLHDPSAGAEGFRKSAGDSKGTFKPAPAEHLASTIESAFRWFTAESFAELNPIEQASIVYLRLIEIQPFEQANERTALVAASLFTLRAELPLIIITPKLHRAYRAALDEGARMNTKPMVELIAEAVEQSLGEMIERQREKVKRQK
jgi:hypothetical protein